MYMVFRRLLVCLLWLWMPVSRPPTAAGCAPPTQSTRQRAPAGANREQWRHSPAFRRSAGKGLENLLALAEEGGIAPAIARTRRWR